MRKYAAVRRKTNDDDDFSSNYQMNEKVIRYAVGDFSIKEAFEIIDLLFERGYASSCLEKNGRWIVEIFSGEEVAEAEISAILQNYRFFKIESIELTGINWLKKCFENFRPITVGDFYIRGSHLRSEATPVDKIMMEIAAATAFGTGEHPTTSSCLIACQTFFDEKQHKIALDVGCGSGILSIALAKLGARRVYAYDNDEEAVRVSRENIEINKVASRVEVAKNKSCEFDCRSYDFIVANILADPLIAISNAIVSSLKGKGVLVLSGFMADENDVLQKYLSLGLKLKFRYDHSGWIALVLEKAEPHSANSANRI
jgi:ribosomal protein L11 methyltransferase